MLVLKLLNQEAENRFIALSLNILLVAVKLQALVERSMVAS